MQVDVDEEHPVENSQESCLDQMMQINTTRLKANSSLQTRCLNAIIDCFRNDSKHQLGFMEIAGLPMQLREELLKKLDIANRGALKKHSIPLSARFDIVLHLIPGIKNFSFKWLEPSTKRELKMDARKYIKKETSPSTNSVFQLLAEKCSSSLRSLVVGTDQHLNDTIQLKNYRKSFKVRLQNLLNMKSLCLLELHHDVLNDEAFRKICHTLVKLRQLKCNLLEVELEAIEEGVCKLKMLEVFAFKAWERVGSAKVSIRRAPERTQLMIRFCLHRFPRLKVVGCLADEYYGENRLDPTTCCSIFSENIRNSETYPSMLQHMIIGQPMTETQADFHSNVTALGISFATISKQEYMTPLLKLNKIKSLIAYGELNEEYLHALVNFLSVQGSSLQDLEIQSPVNEDMLFAQVLSLCPQLRSIKMCPAPALPKNMNIDNLTEISLSELSAIFRPYVVVKLFTAPALRTLVLKDLWIDISSVTVALNDIVSSAAQVASKLVFLEVSVRCPTQHLNEHGKFREDVPDNWTDLMTYILCNAPLLSNVYLKNCVPELSNIVNAINQRSQFE